jgi:hypothetical protein
MILPYGNRILCKRTKIGERIGKEGIILTSDSTKEKTTDIAEVIYVPDHSFADKELIAGSEKIIKSLGQKAQQGDIDALKGLLELNNYLKVKMIRPGDRIFIGTYSGVNFHDTKSPDMQTIVREDEIIGLVQDG